MGTCAITHNLRKYIVPKLKRAAEVVIIEAKDSNTSLNIAT